MRQAAVAHFQCLEEVILPHPQALPRVKTVSRYWLRVRESQTDAATEHTRSTSAGSMPMSPQVTR